MTKRDKVTVDNIIGLVHTDEMTNSVEEVRKLRGRTNERFTLVDDYLIEYDGDYFDLHKPSDIRSLVTIIKYVTDENEQLKQFQDRVFSWIDMHLQRLPTLRDDEFESDNEFADPSLYNGAIQILETMKKELKGDVE